MLNSLFRDSSKSTPYGLFDVAHATYQAIDGPAVEWELDLLKLAAQQAADDLPNTDSREFDGPQTKTQKYIVDIIKEEARNVREGVDEYDRKIRETDLTPIETQMREAGSGLAGELNHKLEEYRDPLTVAKRDVRHLTTEYEGFRQKHKLDRKPDYPPFRRQVISYCVLLAVLETILNGWFFAAGSELGYLGGVVFALLFAAADVIISAVLGRFSSQITHINTMRKVVGSPAVLLLIVWIPGYNLVVAHLREALQILEWQEAMQAAWSSFQNNPFGLNQADSWLFFSLGAVISVTTAVFGWKLDDPYPGYGKLHRDLEKLREDYQELKGDLREDGRALLHRHLEQLTRSVAEARARVDTLQTIVRTKVNLAQNWKTCVESRISDANSILQTYREANERHRETPTPNYFDDLWRYDVEPEIIFTRPEDEAEVTKQSHHLGVIQKLGQSCRRECEARYGDFEVERASY